MQAGSDAPPSHADLASTAENDRSRAAQLPGETDRARTAQRPADVAPNPVLQAAAAAASRLASDEALPPFELGDAADDEHRPAEVQPAPARSLTDGAAVDAQGDEALMRAFAAGDAEAFTRLYDRHERATWRFIRHRLGRAHEAAADDVMQETWMSVARAAPRYVASARFTTWLFAIARSRAIDYLRVQAHATLSLDAPLDGSTVADESAGRWADELPADAAHEPAIRVETRQQAEAFLGALAQLPALQREAFVLQAEAGLSLEEIARATGVGSETAKTRLRYAKAKLRTLLAEWRST
jgi:RNA polymerase sigma-70 factor (ECF subfamily)